jgi:hypothetical protein
MQVILRDGALIGPDNVSLLHSDLSIDCPWFYLIFFKLRKTGHTGNKKQKTESRKQKRELERW